MNVAFTPEMQKFVDEQVKSGRYPSVDDLIQSAVSRLKTSDELIDADIDDLRMEAAVGLDQADRGDFADFTAETIIAEGRKILEARRAAASQGK